MRKLTYSIAGVLLLLSLLTIGPARAQAPVPIDDTVTEIPVTLHVEITPGDIRTVHDSASDGAIDIIVVDTSTSVLCEVVRQVCTIDGGLPDGVPVPDLRVCDVQTAIDTQDTDGCTEAVCDTMWAVIDATGAAQIIPPPAGCLELPDLAELPDCLSPIVGKIGETAEDVVLREIDFDPCCIKGVVGKIGEAADDLSIRSLDPETDCEPTCQGSELESPKEAAERCQAECIARALGSAPLVVIVAAAHGEFEACGVHCENLDEISPFHVDADDLRERCQIDCSAQEELGRVAARLCEIVG